MHRADLDKVNLQGRNRLRRQIERRDGWRGRYGLAASPERDQDDGRLPPAIDIEKRIDLRVGKPEHDPSRQSRIGGNGEQVGQHRPGIPVDVAIRTCLIAPGVAPEGTRPDRDHRGCGDLGLLARCPHHGSPIVSGAELAQARDEIAQSLGRPGGRTVIGAMPLARSALVPRAVLAFAAGHPAHAVGILEGPYETLLAALRSGRADILVGALRDPPAPDVVQEHLFEDPLALIVRMGHPLADAGRAPSLADLAGFAWIAPRAESPLRRQFDLLSQQLGQGAVAAPIECNSLSAARALLLGSDRIMLLSEHQVHHELASAQLVALPHPLGPLSRAIGLTRRRNWHPTAAQARLLEVLREQCQRIGSGGAAFADARVIQRAGMPAAPSRARKARGERRLARVKKRLK